MRNRTTGIIAAGTFGIGLLTGLATAAWLDGDGTAASSSLAAPAHPNMSVGERTLDDAVRASVGILGGGTGPAMLGDAAPELAAGTPAALLARAEVQRRQRRFPQAVDTYKKVIAEGGMSADAWADYADAIGAITSSLKGEPEAAIGRALAMNPRHAKALWLKASLEHETREYVAAAATWRELLAVVPPDSSDARIIEANIAQAVKLAGDKG
jgi:tetratricopeptide (TPR) repeat protein